MRKWLSLLLKKLGRHRWVIRYRGLAPEPAGTCIEFFESHGVSKKNIELRIIHPYYEVWVTKESLERVPFADKKLWK